VVAASAVAGILAFGAGAAGVGFAHERSRAERRDGQAASQAATAIEDQVVRSMAALRGAAALGVDGTVTPDEFEAYATDVVGATDFPSLQLVQVVPGPEREVFEDGTGIAIEDREGDELVPAAERRRYLPVVDVVPDDAEAAALLGFDFAGDPVGAAVTTAATEQRQPVLAPASSLSTDGRAGFVLVQPLFARSRGSEDRLVGFVSSALAADDLVASARDRVPDGTRVTLFDGDTALAGDAVQGGSARVRAGDRSWTVVADHPGGPGLGIPVAIGIATLLLAGLLVYSARLDRRYQETSERLTQRLADDASRDAVLAMVARRLSFAADTDTVIEVVSSEVAAVIGADYADVGLLRDAEHITMSNRGTPLDAATLGSYERVSLDLHVPTAEAVREGRTVVVEDLVAYQRHHPELLAAVRAAGVTAAAASPLYGTGGAVSGVLAFGWTAPVAIDASTRSMVETLARLCGQTLRRTELAERTTQLAELAAAMAVAASAGDVADRLRDHARYALRAVHANVRVLDPAAGRLGSVVPSGPPADLDDRYLHVPLDAPVPLADAVRRDAAVWIADLDEYAARYPEAVDDARRAGFAAAAVLPLHDSSGTAIGAAAFAWADAMVFDSALVSAVSTVTDVAAQTLERTRLAGVHQRRAEALGTLAQALATTVTRAGVAAAVAENVPRLVEARQAVIAVGDAGARFLEPLYPPGADDAAATDGSTAGEGTDPAVEAGPRPLDEGTPETDAFWSGDLVTFPDASSAADRYPHLEGRAVAPGLDATAHLPLRDPEAQVIGVLSIGWSAPVAFDPTLLALLNTVADLIGQTLERATLHEGEHAVVAALQRRLLTPTPTVAGLDIAVHYEPASGAVGIGGDWYDTIALDDGSLVVVVGDVTGHGVEAVAAMAQLQHLIAGLIRTDTPLDRVFAQANSMLAEGDAIYATAQLIHVDHRWRRVGYLSAGHPPALLRLPNGDVTTLDDARQPLIGLPLQPSRLGYLEMPPGSLVLAYTDGLVERRMRPMPERIALLADELGAAAADRPIDALLQDLVVAARRPDDAGVPLDDDVAAVLIRSHP